MIIEATWRKLAAESEKRGATPSQLGNLRAAYVAALYAASASVAAERAHTRDISEAAFRIEMCGQ